MLLLLFLSLFVISVQGIPPLPIQKYQPYIDRNLPLPYNVKCYNIHTGAGTKPSSGIDPGVYLFFHGNKAVYVGKAVKDIWAEITVHFTNGYNKDPAYAEVCYVVMEPNSPHDKPVLRYNYDSYIVESLMLATFCFDSNSVIYGGNAVERELKPRDLISKELANFRCDAGYGNVIERMSYFATNIHNVAIYLYNAQSVNIF